MEFPLKLQPAWLGEQLQDIRRDMPVGKQSTSKTLLRCNYMSKKQKFSYSAILFVYRFLTILPESNTVVAILSDRNHLIHAVIPYKTSKAFEAKHGQRITHNMTGTLICLKDAEFQYASGELAGQLVEQHKAAAPKQDRSIIVLQINDFEIFQRDQIEVSWDISKRLTYVYNSVLEGK